VLAFGFSAALARSAWNFAFFQSMPFPQIDPDAVQRQVRKRAYKRPWLEVSVTGSALTAAAAMFQEPLMLVPLLAGIILIATFGVTRGFILFKRGVAELGIEWPPKASD
jgi:hypothetical protein